MKRILQDDLFAGERKITKAIQVGKFGGAVLGSTLLTAGSAMFMPSAEAAEIIYDGVESNPAGAVIDTGFVKKINPDVTAIKTLTITNGSGGNIAGGEINATGYTVNIQAGDWSGIWGGRAGNNVSGNTVNMSGGTANFIMGGYTNYDKDNPEDSLSAIDNHVVISGGEIAGGIFGGNGADKAAENSVTITGGTVKGMAIGGSGNKATDNQVTILGGTICGEVDGNYGDVYGGIGEHADNNTVTIGGNVVLQGKVSVYGGQARAGQDTAGQIGTANNNTVNILASLVFEKLVGGDGAVSKGNTLNIAASGVTADALFGYQNFNFYIPKDFTVSDTMLTVDSDVDISNAAIGVLAQGTLSNIYKNDKLTLLKSNGTLKANNISQAMSWTVPTSIANVNTYDFSVVKEGSTIVAVVTGGAPENTNASNTNSNNTSNDNSAVNVEAVQNTKSLVETRAGSTTLINGVVDMTSSQGFQQAANAVAAENAATVNQTGSAFVSTMVPYAAMGGGSMRAESGSYVDTKSYGMNIGFAKEIKNRQGRLLFGPMVEYTKGSYDSYLDNGVHGNGNSSAWGLGVMARQSNHDGLYYEGSFRIGKAKSDYRGYVNRQNITYDTSSTYWAAHIGVGKVHVLDKSNSIDTYLKYYYSHQGSDDVTMHADITGDEQWHFDAVDSHRLRLGARFNHAINDKNSIYGGVAYQYEFGGEARAHYNGGSAPSPSVKGSSEMFEIGWQIKASDPVTVDIGVSGWTGKQRGVTAQVGLCLKF